MKPYLSFYFRLLFCVGLLMHFALANAQQLQPAPWNDPAIVWPAPPQAQIKVQNELDQIQPQLADLTPGTAAHTDLLRRILFYKSMLRSLLKELPVPQAIDAAMPEAASMGGLYEHAYTPEATLRALYDEALALLTS